MITVVTPSARERETRISRRFRSRELDGGRDLAPPSELDETLEELTRLTALRDGQAALIEVLELLDGDGEDAVLAQFARALGRLPDGEAYDAVATATRSGRSTRPANRFTSSRRCADPDAFDPRTLTGTRDRGLTLLQHVARKYGGTLELALATL